MSHFARVETEIVRDVIVAEQNFIDQLPNPELWIQTSYNTRGGIHYGQDGLPDGGEAIRKNYAGIGYKYDSGLDAFYSNVTSSLYELDTDTCLWHVKPEYLPLVSTSTVSIDTTLPTGTPGQPIIVNSIVILNEMTVFFSTLDTEPGLYIYDVTSGTFSENTDVKANSSTILPGDVQTTVYKWDGISSWVATQVA